MSDVNLNLYKIFCKVAQSRSYADASKKLNLSVANISARITNLEEQLGLKLFNREIKGVTLTEDGKELYEIVNKCISGFDFAEKLAKDKNSMETGNIKIGCPSHLTSYFLMDKVEQAKKDFPDLKITIVCEVDAHKMLQLLQNHEIDFAVTDAKIDDEKVEIEELVTIDNIFVSKTPLTILDIKEIEDLNCILNVPSTRTTKRLKELLKSHNVDVKADIVSDATEVRIDAVKRNLGIAYIMKDAVKKELEKKELYEVEIPIQLPNLKVNLIYYKGEITKADKKFIKEYLRKK